LLTPPVLMYLGLGDVLRESLSISRMDMDAGADLLLGWDCISSHDLRHLYQAGRVDIRSGPVRLQLALLPAAGAPASLSTVMAQGELHRYLGQLVRDDASATMAAVDMVAPAAELGRGGARCTGWPRWVHADYAALAAMEETAWRTAQARRRHGGPSRPPSALTGRFVAGVEVLRDGTELHLASFGLADAERRLAGYDDPAFAPLKAEYADVLGGAPPGLPPERGMELVIEATPGRAADAGRRAEAAVAPGEAAVGGGAGGAAHAARRRARPRVDPALDCEPCCLSCVGAEARRDVAHLLRLQRPQRHQPAGGGATPAH
jgi:hypothetical protein